MENVILELVIPGIVALIFGVTWSKFVNKDVVLKADHFIWPGRMIVIASVAAIIFFVSAFFVGLVNHSDSKACIDMEKKVKVGMSAEMFATTSNKWKFQRVSKDVFKAVYRLRSNCVIVVIRNGKVIKVLRRGT